ncbi:MAG TPA: peptidylprolyl isomerase [Chitinophagaceae bacterium]|nr:peptidylprolyl isomerase [Chitinophagaceae bacterium]
MNRIFKATLLLVLVLATTVLYSQQAVKLKKRDRKRDVELTTTKGIIVLRLYNETPLHRDNFLRLVKSRYYDSVLFHRVIKAFMIQSGDPDSKRAIAGAELGNGGPAYSIPAEFVPSLFHKKGVLAAAREGDDVNPKKESSGSQFYIVQGRPFSDAGLDSLQTFRLKGRVIPPEQREVYKTLGGTPHLDQNYTVFGEVVRGLDVVDAIAATPTSQQPADRPVEDVRILKATLVKRKK